MENNLVLKAEKRESTGTHSANKVRRRGRIPAVLYGHKKEAVPITLDAHNLVQGVEHGYRVVELELNNDKETAMFKDLQYDFLGKNIVHVDLIRVDVTERVTVSVPIVIKGTAKGTEEGGVLEEVSDSIEVESRVTDIPDSIVVNVSELEIGDNIYAKDVQLPDNIKMISEPDHLLITCSYMEEEKTLEEIEEEAPVAPEVIGEEARKEAPEEKAEKSRGKEESSE